MTSKEASHSGEAMVDSSLADSRFAMSSEEDELPQEPQEQQLEPEEPQDVAVPTVCKAESDDSSSMTDTNSEQEEPLHRCCPSNMDEEPQLPVIDHTRRGEPPNLPLADDYESVLVEQYEAALAAQQAGEHEEEAGRKRKRTNPFNAPVTPREYTYAICVGVLLSFNAGYVNGSCLTGLIGNTGRKVNAASNTGTITLAALALASGDVPEFGFLASNTLSYLLGSWIAGILTPNPRAFRIEPSYGPTFLLGAACLTLSSTLSAVEGNEKWIFHLVSMASGIQNGITSLYSKNLIRSTGFTGTSTDIGIFLGQFLRGNRKNTWKLIVMLCLLLSFWLGGLVSLYATTEFLQFSLLVNASLYLLIGMFVVAFLIFELDVSLGAAVLGTGQWKRALQQLNLLGVMDESSAHLHHCDDCDGGSCCEEDHIDQLFDQFDMDQSGTIDRKELHAALRHAGINISKRQSAQMVKRADKDGDGIISREEFRDMVTEINESGMKDLSSSATSRTSTLKDPSSVHSRNSAFRQSSQSVP